MVLAVLKSSLVPVVFSSVLMFSGCSSERPGEQNAQQPQQNEIPAPTANHTELGKASFYGPGFAGHETANGETFNQNAMTAAHPSLPMGTKAEVTNLDNGKKVEVTINDRGPEVKGRAIDLSSGAAKKLDMKKSGIAHVKIVTKRVKHKVHKRSNQAAESAR
jgi:rare lipoprotein A (peptidoglycan hydrolase)